MTATAPMPATETRSVIVERVMSHPPEKIWRALTQSALMEDWLMSNDFKPVVGHKFTLRAPPQPNWSGIIECEVLVIDPPKTLSYTWGSLGVDTAVTWTLTPQSGGTHVRMEQSGFRPDQPQNYNGAKYGWNKFLANLEQTLARN